MHHIWLRNRMPNAACGMGKRQAPTPHVGAAVRFVVLTTSDRPDEVIFCSVHSFADLDTPRDPCRLPTSYVRHGACTLHDAAWKLDYVYDRRFAVDRATERR